MKIDENKTVSRGKYICIEGNDGSGKSTLVRCMMQHLTNRGSPAAHRWFPSDNMVGALIRSGLRGDVVLNPRSYLYLFCADGLQENSSIERELAAGVTVICDRHPTLSGRVFQVDLHTEELVNQTYDAASNDSQSILVPDFLFIIDIPSEVSLARMQRREKYRDVVFESEDTARIETLRQRYLALAKLTGAVVMDGERPVPELVSAILSQVGLD